MGSRRHHVLIPAPGHNMQPRLGQSQDDRPCAPEVHRSLLCGRPRTLMPLDQNPTRLLSTTASPGIIEAGPLSGRIDPTTTRCGVSPCCAGFLRYKCLAQDKARNSWGHGLLALYGCEDVAGPRGFSCFVSEAVVPSSGGAPVENFGPREAGL